MVQQNWFKFLKALGSDIKVANSMKDRGQEVYWKIFFGILMVVH
jgi:hypothetical protein